MELQSGLTHGAISVSTATKLYLWCCPQKEAAEERRQLQQEKAQLASWLKQCQQLLQQLNADADKQAAETAAIYREQQADMEKCRALQRLLDRELNVSMFPSLGREGRP